MNTVPVHDVAAEDAHLQKVGLDRNLTTAAAPPKVSTATSVARECLAIAYEMAPNQNDAARLSSAYMGRVVSALVSAGNLLSALARIDPAGPAPEGFKKTTSFDAGGAVSIVFEQLSDPSQGADK
jgi:hypothetical protein